MLEQKQVDLRVMSRDNYFYGTMPFPDSQRVIYENNPLEEVICQLRFPPILRISSEAPVAFQERVRGAYPILRENQGTELGANLPPEIVKFMALEASLGTGTTTYDFISADELWTVGLVRDSLSLSTRRYERWEGFKEHLMLPLNSFVEEYSPAFYTRIGLRYRDVIRRSVLGLDGVSWSDLLRPHIAGELSSPDLANAIENAVHQVVVQTGDGHSRVRLQHGLARSKSTDETCYVIDSDFYTEKRTEPRNAIETLDYFNHLSGRLFRWCIADRLHEAMRPRYIQD